MNQHKVTNLPRNTTPATNLGLAHPTTNGCGVMVWRMMPFGEGSLGRSTGISGVVGAQNLCLGHMVFVCGSSLEVVG